MSPRSNPINAHVPPVTQPGGPPAAGLLRVSPLSAVGAPLVYAFLFIAYGRLADYAFPYLHVPFFVGGACALLALLNGALQRTFSSRVGLLMVAFTGWLVLITPLSYWKGGSVQLLMSWGKSLLVFLMIVGLVRTLKQCRRAMYALALAVLVVTLVCIVFGRAEQGQWALPMGLLQNPNDLAQILLLGLPFWWLAGVNEERVPFRRILACISAVPAIVILLFTGSRGGIIAFGIVVLVLFWKASLANKIRLVIAGVMLGVMSMVIIPDAVTARFAVLFQSEFQRIDDPVQGAALGSKMQRIALLKESLRLTLEHPIFGVGPGQFQAYQAHEADEQGEPGYWRETHCTYTQLSSETGLPGFILYVGALLYTLIRSSSLYKRTRHRREFRDIAYMSFALLLALTSFSATAIFSSVAYQMYFPTLAGLSVAFFSAAEAEMYARGFVTPMTAASPAAAQPAGLPVRV